MEMPTPTNSSQAYDFYFQAMTLHRLGQGEQARQWLDKANQNADLELGNQNSPPLWNRKLTLKLLKTEATQVLAGP